MTRAPERPTGRLSESSWSCWWFSGSMRKARPTHPSPQWERGARCPLCSSEQEALGGSICTLPKGLAAHPARGCWGWDTPGCRSPVVSHGASDRGSRRFAITARATVPTSRSPTCETAQRTLGSCWKPPVSKNAGQLLGSLRTEANLP